MIDQLMELVGVPDVVNALYAKLSPPRALEMISSIFFPEVKKELDNILTEAELAERIKVKLQEKYSEEQIKNLYDSINTFKEDITNIITEVTKVAADDVTEVLNKMLNAMDKDLENEKSNTVVTGDGSITNNAPES